MDKNWSPISSTLNNNYSAITTMMDNLELKIIAEIEPQIFELRREFDKKKQKLIEKAKKKCYGWRLLSKAEERLRMRILEESKIKPNCEEESSTSLE